MITTMGRRLQSLRAVVAPRLRFLAVIAAAFLMVPLVGPDARNVATAASGEPAVTAGTFMPANGPFADFGKSASLYIDPGNRVMYVYDTGNGGWLMAYDLDTYKPIGAALNVKSDSVSAIYMDLAGSALIMARVDLSNQTRLEEYTSTATGIVKRGQIILSSSNTSSTETLPSSDTIQGIYRAPASNKLWILAGAGYLSSATPGGVALAQLTLGGASIADAKIDWVRTIPGCPQTMHHYQIVNSGLGYYPPTKSLYFACSQVSPGGTGVVQTQLARGAGQFTLKLDGPLSGTVQPGEFRLYPHSGDFGTGNSHFSATAGRLAMVAYNSASAGSTLFVFDAATSSWVGGLTVSAAQVDQDGLDIVNNRYYSVNSDTGLVWSDLESTPTAQGVAVAKYRDRDKAGRQTGVPLAVDPTTKRLFLKYGTFADFLVVQDTTARYQAPEKADPDKNTTNVEEKPGKTEAAYSAGAQAYGSIVRQVGGYGSSWLNLTGTSDAVLPPLLAGNGNRTPFNRWFVAPRPIPPITMVTEALRNV